MEDGNIIGVFILELCFNDLKIKREYESKVDVLVDSNYRLGVELQQG